MNFHAFFAQLFELAAALLLAPVLNGWVNKSRCLAAKPLGAAPDADLVHSALQAVRQGSAAGARSASSLFPRCTLRHFLVHGAGLGHRADPVNRPDSFPRRPMPSRWSACLPWARVFIALAGMDISTTLVRSVRAAK